MADPTPTPADLAAAREFAGQWESEDRDQRACVETLGPIIARHMGPEREAASVELEHDLCVAIESELNALREANAKLRAEVEQLKEDNDPYLGEAKRIEGWRERVRDAEEANAKLRAVAEAAMVLVDDMTVGASRVMPAGTCEWCNEAPESDPDKDEGCVVCLLRVALAAWKGGV